MMNIVEKYQPFLAQVEDSKYLTDQDIINVHEMKGARENEKKMLMAIVGSAKRMATEFASELETYFDGSRNIRDLTFLKALSEELGIDKRQHTNFITQARKISDDSQLFWFCVGIYESNLTEIAKAYVLKKEEHLIHFGFSSQIAQKILRMFANDGVDNFEDVVDIVFEELKQEAQTVTVAQSYNVNRQQAVSRQPTAPPQRQSIPQRQPDIPVFSQSNTPPLRTPPQVMTPVKTPPFSRPDFPRATQGTVNRQPLGNTHEQRKVEKINHIENVNSIVTFANVSSFSIEEVIAYIQPRINALVDRQTDTKDAKVSLHISSTLSQWTAFKGELNLVLQQKPDLKNVKSSIQTVENYQRVVKSFAALLEKMYGFVYAQEKNPLYTFEQAWLVSQLAFNLLQKLLITYSSQHQEVAGKLNENGELICHSQALQTMNVQVEKMFTDFKNSATDYTKKHTTKPDAHIVLIENGRKEKLLRLHTIALTQHLEQASSAPLKVKEKRFNAQYLFWISMVMTILVGGSFAVSWFQSTHEEASGNSTTATEETAALVQPDYESVIKDISSAFNESVETVINPTAVATETVVNIDVAQDISDYDYTILPPLAPTANKEEYWAFPYRETGLEATIEEFSTYYPELINLIDIDGRSYIFYEITDDGSVVLYALRSELQTQ